jgi:hypothetical protein
MVRTRVPWYLPWYVAPECFLYYDIMLYLYTCMYHTGTITMVWYMCTNGTSATGMSTRAVVPHRDWRRRPTPRSKWRSTPTKTTSSRLSWRQVGGRVNKAARDWLDALMAPDPGEPGRPPVEPADADYLRPTGPETVLREAMQALVRVQAHMLARIVVEIRAADTAVELEPQM